MRKENMNNLQSQEREVTGKAQRQNGHGQAWAPPVDIYETRDAYVLVAEMPGVRKDGLEITVEGSTLTMLGRRAQELLEAAALHRESKGADYRRVFKLDPMIDSGKIRARVDQGVVTVELPKAEQVKPRKIKVGD
jgi:HSP20 family protein